MTDHAPRPRRRYGPEFLADAEGMKVCRTCSRRQPVEEFHNRQDQPDRRCPYCRTCKRATHQQHRPHRLDMMRRRYRRHRAEPLPTEWTVESHPYLATPDGMKRCVTCKASKPVEDFYNRRDTADHRCPRCRTCKRAEYAGLTDGQRARHRERTREATRRYRARLRAARESAAVSSS